jgi:hypothetical protein
MAGMKALVIAVLAFPLVHGAYVAMLGTSLGSSPLLMLWFPLAYIALFVTLFCLNRKRNENPK